MANDLTYTLFKAREKIINQYKEQRREKELEARITKRVLEQISIEVLNEAGPVIKELQQQLHNLLPTG